MNALDKHSIDITSSYMTSLSVSKKKKKSLFVGRNPRKWPIMKKHPAKHKKGNNSHCTIYHLSIPQERQNES